MKGLLIIVALLAAGITSKAQMIHIDDFRAKDLNIYQEDTVLYYGGPFKDKEIKNGYKYYAINSDLQITDTTVIAIPKKQEYINGFFNKNGYYYITKSEKGCFVYNNYSDSTTLLEQFNWKGSNIIKCKLYGDGQSLFLVKTDLKKDELSLTKITNEGHIVWEKSLNIKDKRERLVDIYFTKDLAHAVIANSSSLSEKNYTLRSINKSDSSHFDNPLNNYQNIKSVDFIELLDNELYIAGRTNTSTGEGQLDTKKIFIAKLNSNNKQFDFKIDEGDDISTMKVLWQDLQLINGKILLLGENYFTSSAASDMAQMIATGILTGGSVFTGVSKLKVKDVIIVDINEGFSSSYSNTEIPKTTYSIVSALGSLGIIDYAKKQGVFRFQGMINENEGLYLANNTLFIINILSGQLIRTIPNFDWHFKILGIMDCKIIFGIKDVSKPGLNIGSFTLCDKISAD